MWRALLLASTAFVQEVPSRSPDELRVQAERETDPNVARGLLREAFATLVDTEITPVIANSLALLALAARRLGDLEIALEAQTRVVSYYETIVPNDHRELQVARQNLAAVMFGMDDLLGARKLSEQVLAILETSLPEDHPDVQAARNNLASTLFELGDLSGAGVLREKVLASRTRTLADDDPALQRARVNMAGTLFMRGDLAGARALQEQALAIWVRTRPEDDPELLTTRTNLAISLQALGDLAGARDMLERVLVVRERTLPEDHPDLLSTRGSLASVMLTMGELAGARALFEHVLAVRESTLPDDHPEVQLARQGVASTMKAMGDLRGARAMNERTLAIQEAMLPADHPDLQLTRTYLAVVLQEMGDLSAARSLQEQVLEVLGRTLPADHAHLQLARLNVASTMHALGDLAGSRALVEQVLEVFSRTLPADHPHLQAARLSLASTRKALGDLDGARAVEAEVVESLERSLPDDHPDLLTARAHLASTLREAGDAHAALDLQQAVLEARERTLPDDHPDVQVARQDLAVTLATMGRTSEARTLQERVHAVLERSLPPDHPDLHRARRNLIWSDAMQEDWADLRSRLDPWIAGFLVRLRSSLALSPREAREAVGSVSDALSILLSIELAARGEITTSPQAFAIGEKMRAISAGDSRAGTRAQDSSRDLNEIIAARSSPRDVATAVLERDRVEGRLPGQDLPEFEHDVLARALSENSAAVAYRVYTRYEFDATERHRVSGTLALLAFVLRPDATLTRVELGDLAPIEEAVDLWRVALGETSGRGVSAAATASETRSDIGESLRKRILDAVLDAAGDAHTLHVCIDGSLHLVPLDALPLEQGVVGDRYAFRNEVSFTRLLQPTKPLPRSGEFVALGGVDFGGDESLAPARDAGPFFARLPATRSEVEETGELFVKSFDLPATLLTDSRASKQALYDAAPTVRFLHLATHGYFADESVRSWADDDSAESTVTGLAPMALCGLALAGANHGIDSRGRLPGIITGEEIAGMNLSQCELAVLSACETNAGVRRAGQGIASLQAALHAAGARTTITSLWKVDDAATRALMVEFYRLLWIDGETKADALWHAKQMLRERGSPVRDWAAWVLTGAPD